jgi:hypothetical protein
MQRNRLTTGTIELLLVAGLLGAGAPRAAAVVARGGTVTNYTDANGKIWTAHIFTTNHVATGDTNLVVTFGGTIDYLVIGGGGGGGSTDNGVYVAGGGGAGQVREGTADVSAAGAITIMVGAGGAGAGIVNSPGGNGSSSTLVLGGATIMALGGGGGAGVNTAPAEGTVASTGGGGSNAGNPRTPATNCFAGGSGGGEPQAGGGGGGSTGVGGNATPSSGGAGGPGYTPAKPFGASPVIYAAGGGGGMRSEGGHPPPGKGGGSGAGGNGGGGGAGVKAQSGNTYGSGGGGTAAVGANGGGGHGASGVVIVRYEADTPNIANRPVTALTTNSATFNALLASMGTSVAAVYVLWGEENGAATGAWAHTNGWKAGAWKSDTRPATNISLTPNRMYHYTFGAANATTNVVADAPVSFLTGAVGVKTSKRESSESSPADFIIFRPATATNGALAVNYTLAGTAINGRDYDRLDSPAIIPAGAAEVRLPIVPSFNLGDTRAKVVTLTVAPGAYGVGTQSNATIGTRAE